MPEALPENFRDWNEQMVLRYDPEIFHHHPRSMVRWVEGKRVRAVLKSVAARPEHRILDVGCGAGNILAQLPGNRTGVDISDFMVKRATELLRGQAQIINADAEELPFGASEFDRVVASSMLSHVLHPEKVISELRRVVKPDGRVVISIAHEDQIEKGLRWARALGLGGEQSGDVKNQPYHVDYHLHRFSIKRLRGLTEKSFVEVALRKVPTFLFPAHYIVTLKPR
ncbi:MAG TPA: methyltransferase domain-containing protein [Planctomycetota bacterium]|nr:methyltransferase domain-containing protein [Planctomycetota bacterium]